MALFVSLDCVCADLLEFLRSPRARFGTSHARKIESCEYCKGGGGTTYFAIKPCVLYYFLPPTSIVWICPRPCSHGSVRQTRRSSEHYENRDMRTTHRRSACHGRCFTRRRHEGASRRRPAWPQRPSPLPQTPTTPPPPHSVQTSFCSPSTTCGPTSELTATALRTRRTSTPSQHTQHALRARARQRSRTAPPSRGIRALRSPPYGHAARPARRHGLGHPPARQGAQRGDVATALQRGGLRSRLSVRTFIYKNKMGERDLKCTVLLYCSDLCIDHTPAPVAGNG